MIENIEDESQNEQLAQIVVDEADTVLDDMNTVLEQMLDIENYNELLDIVRALIEDQKELNSETKKLRVKSLLGD